MWSDQISKEEARTTAAGRVARELAGRIADGSLPPGSKLPGETVLARSLGVSRPTVREAIRTLAARRLLAIRARSGTYVTAFPLPGEGALLELADDDPERLWELVEIRRLVDPAVAALAAARRNPASLAALAAALGKMEGAAGDAWAAALEAYRSFFGELARAGRNALLAHLARSVLAVILDRLPRGERPAVGEYQSVLCGAPGLHSIYSAVERGDGVGARGSTEQHLELLERRLRESGVWS